MDAPTTNKSKKSFKHKKHFCIFCKNEYIRIAEHFVRKHKDEDKVKEVLSIKDGKKRLWEWKKLRQQGDYLFNTSEEGGKRIIVKDPMRPSARKKYFNCSVCFARIRTCSRTQHLNMCKNILKPTEELVADIEEDVLNGLPEEIINKIRKSIYLSGFLKQMSEIKQNRQHIRTMARDLINFEDSLRKQTGLNKPLTHFCVPSHADDIIKAIKSSSGYVRNKNIIMKYPYKAQTYCRLIKNLCKFVMALHSKKNMDRDTIEMTKFLNIFIADSDKLIKSQALRSIKLRNLRNPKKLPKTSDIKVLIEKLRNDTPALIFALQENKNAANWRKLAENLLCRLTIFNRRRGGAVEKMKISDYESTEIKLKTATEEATFNLTEEEKGFLGEIKIVEITHKCDNLIPIFISKEIQHGMDTLLENRKFGDINEGNEYFFAASKKSKNPISGVKALEKYREIFPENIKKLFTSTNLRKHGATVAQVLDLSLQDKEEWAAHMGHTMAVHNRYYRKAEQVNAVLRTGRLLNAIDKGVLKFYKGKKITEIPLKVTKPANEKAEVNDENGTAAEQVISEIPAGKTTTSKDEAVTLPLPNSSVLPEVTNFSNSPLCVENSSSSAGKPADACEDLKDTSGLSHKKSRDEAVTLPLPNSSVLPQVTNFSNSPLCLQKSSSSAGKPVKACEDLKDTSGLSHKKSRDFSAQTSLSRHKRRSFVFKRKYKMARKIYDSFSDYDSSSGSDSSVFF